MDLINQFIENYKKKLTFYENLGRISSSQLEDALQSAGIRAMVTYRIKNPGRLKSKILRRNVKRKRSTRILLTFAASVCPCISQVTA